MLNITVVPVGQRGGKFVPKYLAYLGDRLLCESRTPFLTAARILQAEGIPDETPITMSHKGSSVVSFKTTIGIAAGLIVEETETRSPTFRKYRPFPSEAPQGVRRQSPKAAIITQNDDGEETPFSDDHLREVGRTYV